MIMTLVWCGVIYMVFDVIFKSENLRAKKIASVVLPTVTLMYILFVCMCVDSLLEGWRIIPTMMVLATLAVCCGRFLKDNNDEL